MAYTPNEWACGDAVTAEKLNNIERGISEMNSEYVPTEWQCGDTITAEKLNKIEQGIASGGGSSDFSTAEVTINIPSIEPVQIPYIINEEQGGTVFDGGITNSGTYTVPLYKGMLVADYSSISDRTITVTGNIVANEPLFVITGDCTITIS